MAGREWISLMTRKSVYTFTCIALIFCVLLASGGQRTAHLQGVSTSAATSPATSRAPSAVATSEAVKPASGPAYKIINSEEQLSDYDRYSLRYPIIDTGVTNAEGFNQAVNDFVESQYDTFLSDPNAEGLTETWTTSLLLGFDIHVWSDDILSVQLLGTLTTGGTPRPGFFSYGINYSLKTGKLLTLADLFKPKALYLDNIAPYVLNDLLKQNKEFDRRSLPTTPETYSRWNITQAGLLITFDEFQIKQPTIWTRTPRVLIPYGALGPIINPDGPLAAYVK
jgi:hypothetical protein